MLSRSRRRLIVAGSATLLYGARFGLAGEPVPTGESPPAAGRQIALLLPLAAPNFARAADFVRQGFLAAAKADTAHGYSVVVHTTTESPDQILSAYEQARMQGARMVVGPLTRNGVSRIAQHMQAGPPVLALNMPENDTPLPENFYAFSLQVENEARQIALMAFADGRRSVLTVSDAAPLMRRIHKAFTEAFVREGARVVADFTYRNTTADLLALREAANNGQCDAIFLALDATRARLVRPYVDGPAQVYATSQVFDGRSDAFRDAELNGVRFVDMPWLLLADHPAVMVYPRPDAGGPASADFERLYAFGIDAFRVATDLLHNANIAREGLDGVTGRISLGPGRLLVRELTPAQFQEGRAVPLATGK